MLGNFFWISCQQVRLLGKQVANNWFKKAIYQNQNKVKEKKWYIKMAVAKPIPCNENRVPLYWKKVFPSKKKYKGKTLFWPCTGSVRDCRVFSFFLLLWFWQSICLQLQVRNFMTQRKVANSFLRLKNVLLHSFAFSKVMLIVLES